MRTSASVQSEEQESVKLDADKTVRSFLIKSKGFYLNRVAVLFLLSIVGAER